MIQCPKCGAVNRIVNLCRCDPNNLPTRPILRGRTIFPYAVIPAPGMYGNGKVRAYSRHLTRTAALAVAEQVTARHQRNMEPYGGTGGHYYAVEWGIDGTHFNADSPPPRLDEKAKGE